MAIWPKAKPSCRWWESTGCDGIRYYAECNGLEFPLVGAQAEVAQAVERDTGACYCPWCGGDIVFAEDGEVADDYAADEELRDEVRRMKL